MTELPDSNPNIAVEIRALRHDVLAAGQNLDWDVVRGRIRRLLIKRRPSPDARIYLLELYDQVATRVERQRAGDEPSLRRLRHQRASDTLVFPFVEARDDGLSPWAIIDREVAAGRLRVDPYLSAVLGQILQALDARPDGAASALARTARPFPFRSVSAAHPPARLLGHCREELRLIGVFRIGADH